MTGNFVAKLLHFCKKEQLIRKGDRIVAGVSGGADSVCLLQFLYEIREEWELALYVLHVHHGIRGEEADRDASLVKDMADQLGLPYCLVKKDVPALAAAEGLSLEEAGRKARYEAFEAHRAGVGADAVAVAHHMDDQAETVLFHLFRGTGARGLGGIPARRGNIIRPLLPVSREEIKAFLKERGLPYAVDRTNLVPACTRNKIRLQLLPDVKREINGQAVRHTAEAADKIRQWSRYIERQGETAAARMTVRRDGDICLSVDEFMQEDPAIRDEVLRRIFAEFIPGSRNVGQSHYEQARELAAGASGRQVHFPGNLMAVREYGVIRFGRATGKGRGTDAGDADGDRDGKRLPLACPVPSAHTVDGNGERFRFSLSLVNRSDLPGKFPEKDYTKWLDYDKIKDGLVLRHPLEGDYFILNNNGDRKKLNRYYMDRKIPSMQRARQLVLAADHHVVWALPDRISAACRISELTTKVLVVTKERV